jgi:hypothetical protein
MGGGGDSCSFRVLGGRVSHEVAKRQHKKKHATAFGWNEYLFGDNIYFLFCRTNSVRDLIFV